MSRIAILIMVASASSLVAVQLNCAFRFRESNGPVNACPSEDAAALETPTISEIIARFELWRGSTCVPRLGKPFSRG